MSEDKTQINQSGKYGLDLEALPKDYILDNRYKIEAKIGTGGFGTVYKAWDDHLDRYKALKIIHKHFYGDKEVISDLKQEAKILMNMKSDHVVRLWDIHLNGDIKYIDMEYIDGGDLVDLKLSSANKKIPEDKVIELAKQIANGMKYIHDNNVIHKDIKPQNIMLTKDGTVKIMDFGISETFRSSMSRIKETSRNGTPAYMSPEQLIGKDVGKESDVWSFGVMLYELLSGKQLYSGQSYSDVLMQIERKQFEPITYISEKINSLIQNCLQYNYKDRFRDFAEIEEDLRIKEEEDRKKELEEKAEKQKEKQRKEEQVKLEAEKQEILRLEEIERGKKEREEQEKSARIEKEKLDKEEKSKAKSKKEEKSETQLIKKNPKAVVIISLLIIISIIVYIIISSQSGSKSKTTLHSANTKEQTTQTIDTIQDKINLLLKQATTHYNSNKLTKPVGGNAYESYKKVLEIDSNNSAAMDGFRKIADKYESWADNNKSSGKWDKAISQYNKALEVGGYNLSVKQKIAFCEDKLGKPVQLVVCEEGPTIVFIRLNEIFVKGGTFQMGSNDGADIEKPVHSVTVSDFYIGKYEVTQKEWKDIMGSNPSKWKGDNYPVERVSWNDVQKFIKKLNTKTGLNYRLPTEAEWEFAARGGNKSNGYKYSGSNSIGDVAWYDSNSNSKTHSVGGKQPNELGIYDMSGNVWEWCNDRKENYSSSSQTNPKGASSGSDRVLRGGSWGSLARLCRVAYRYSHYPGDSYSIIGFRLLRSSR